jgi:hypothetical protein
MCDTHTHTHTHTHKHTQSGFGDEISTPERLGESLTTLERLVSEYTSILSEGMERTKMERTAELEVDGDGREIHHSMSDGSDSRIALEMQ